MVIREATIADLDHIQVLSSAWEREDITYGMVATSREAYEALLGPFFLVAEDAGALVGFITGITHVSEGMAVIPAGVTYLEIDELHVISAHRSQGIGRALVETLLARAEEEGITHQLVYSATKDIRRVLHFYEQCGFQSWCIQLYRNTAEGSS